MSDEIYSLTDYSNGYKYKYRIISLTYDLMHGRRNAEAALQAALQFETYLFPLPDEEMLSFESVDLVGHYVSIDDCPREDFDCDQYNLWSDTMECERLADIQAAAEEEEAYNEIFDEIALNRHIDDTIVTTLEEVADDFLDEEEVADELLDETRIHGPDSLLTYDQSYCPISS